MVIMSKRFKPQDYFRYKKLGKRWRRPVGLQSNLRLKKGGSGLRPAIGYGTPHAATPTLIRNIDDFIKDCSNGVIFSSGLGSKKTLLFTAKAKELNLRIFNMKKVKRASRLQAQLKKRKENREEEEKKAKEEAKQKEKTAQKKMGFDDDVVPQIHAGKSKTYRLRDHGLKVGDQVVFENTQKGEKFGSAKITKVEKIAVKNFNLNDPEHYVVYTNTEELIAALKKRNPDKEVNTETEMFAYN